MCVEINGQDTIYNLGYKSVPDWIYVKHKIKYHMG